MKAMVFVVAMALSVCGLFCASAHAETGPEIVTEVTTDKQDYAQGEPVTVTVVVKNLGDEDVELTFPSSLQVYYVVTDSLGSVVYSLKSHVYVYWWLTYLTVEAGGSHTQVFDGVEAWGQVDDDGEAAASPGTYRVTGELDTTSVSYEAGESVLTLGGGLEAVPEFSSGMTVAVSAAVVAGILYFRRRAAGDRH